MSYRLRGRDEARSTPKRRDLAPAATTLLVARPAMLLRRCCALSLLLQRHLVAAQGYNGDDDDYDDDDSGPSPPRPPCFVNNCAMCAPHSFHSCESCELFYVMGKDNNCFWTTWSWLQLVLVVLVALLCCCGCSYHQTHEYHVGVLASTTRYRSGAWRGFYMQSGRIHSLARFTLEFYLGKVTGQGVDDVGHFTVSGLYGQSGAVAFTKKYTSRSRNDAGQHSAMNHGHAVEYRGSEKREYTETQYEATPMSKIEGNWWIAGQNPRGTFSLWPDRE